jgi:hypothetical protein
MHQSRFVRAAFVFAGLTCLASGQARAGTLLYAQAVIPDDTGIGPGGLLAVGSSCPFNNSAAEDFTLAANASITRITWEGVYFGAASDFPGVDNNFHVTFYEDNGSGNVATIVADFPSVAVSKALHPRPPIFGTNPVYTYDATLPAPVPATGGQRYWLSINGDPTGPAGPVFGWAASPEGNAAKIPGNDQPLQTDSITCASLPATSYTPGGVAGDQDADLAFALYSDTGNGTVVPLDIKPGSCPNSFNRNSNGVLPVALVGTDTFDVASVDITSLEIARADGVGGGAAPNEGPPGPHTVVEDVTAPFAGEPCDCDELSADGIMDLSMKFWSNDVVEALELDDLPAGEFVELELSGMLMDGTAFTATDCIRLVPPGDMDGDGAVGAADLLGMLGTWGPCPAPPAECLADLNDDGKVDVPDLLALLANWGSHF